MGRAAQSRSTRSNCMKQGVAHGEESLSRKRATVGKRMRRQGVGQGGATTR